MLSCYNQMFNFYCESVAYNYLYLHVTEKNITLTDSLVQN
jgi:hypothetical protein